jgi:oligopeptide transport system substrate-binding protein
MADRVAEARRLYAEAGYSAANPLRFEVRYNAGEVHTKVAVAVAAMWKAALGVEAKLVAVEFKSLLQDIDRREVDVFRSSWVADYDDAWSHLQYLRSDFGINLPRYRSTAYDALLARAAAEADVAKRRALLEQAERTALADHPLIPLYFYVNKHLVKPQVQGWYDNAMNVVYSKDLALASADLERRQAAALVPQHAQHLHVRKRDVQEEADRPLEPVLAQVARERDQLTAW